MRNGSSRTDRKRTEKERVPTPSESHLNLAKGDALWAGVFLAFGSGVPCATLLPEYRDPRIG
jgi:hypothetical protein